MAYLYRAASSSLCSFLANSSSITVANEHGPSGLNGVPQGLLDLTRSLEGDNVFKPDSIMYVKLSGDIATGVL